MLLKVDSCGELEADTGAIDISTTPSIVLKGSQGPIRNFDFGVYFMVGVGLGWGGGGAGQTQHLMLCFSGSSENDSM